MSPGLSRRASRWPNRLEQMYDQRPMTERLLRDPRFQPDHVVGALVDGRAICVSHMTEPTEDTTTTLERIRASLKADRLGWLTRLEALASGRIDCEECGASLPGLG